MRQYELTYLTPANLAENELKTTQEKISSLIQAGGGAVMEVKASASLTILDFQMEPEKLSLLDKKLREGSKILRYMITLRQHFREMPERKRRLPLTKTSEVSEEKAKATEKVEIAEIEKKLEEILGET